ncbi:MAG: TonB-dependent receptor [Thermonemataceae bacterium]|nr:TonB-dependent receptor [Thermonemataceae bacterium]
MNKILVLPLMILGISASAQQVTIQDTLKTQELDEVTIIGNRGKSIPGSGQSINIHQLEKLNQPNINNVLRVVPGVNIRDEEGFGLRPNIGLRGTPVNRSTKITLMEDGILIAPAPYADPSAYYFPTFARMQGVEVLKGSSQIKYGPYTIGGAVNLLSTPIPSSFKGFAQISYGSFNTNQQRVWIGDSRKNFNYVFEVNRLASNGFKEIDNGGNTGFDRRDVMGKLSWHTNENASIPQILTLKFVNSTENGDETYLGLTFDDYQQNPLRRYAGTQKDILYINHQHISLNHSIIPLKKFSINTTAYYSQTYRDWARANTFGGQSINNILNNPTAQQDAYNIMTGQAIGNIDYQSAARTYFSKGVQLNANYYFITKEIAHKLQMGVRYHTDEADRYATRSVYTITNGIMILTTAGVKGNQENQIRSANSLAAYLTYDIEYKGLKLSPGVRYEKIKFDFQNFGNDDNARLGTALKTATNDLSIFLPGIGLNYEINNEMSIFGGVHKGFSPPGMPSVTSTTGQAKVESSTNYELGYRYETQGLDVQAAAFLNNYTNILGSDNVSGGGAGTGDMFNAGNAKIQGLELSVAYDILHKKESANEIKLPLTLAYTYTSAKFQETFVNGGGDWGSGTINEGDLIPFITPHLLTASLGIESKKFDATLIGRYTGKTRVKPGQDDEIFPAQEVSLANINSLEGFLIVDISANYKISKTFTLFTLLNNLTNNKAIVANLPQGYRPNMPLSFNIGVKANF